MSLTLSTFHSWVLIIAIGILIFLLNIDYTAVNLTLIPISTEINANLSGLQWLLSSYVLTWAAFVIPAGKASDIFGKRKSLVSGLIVFMIGSSLAGLGNSLEILIFGRIVQGLGAAILSTPAWSYIFTTASPDKQGFVMGVILSFAGLGLTLGPALAGFIINKLNWRWIFYINIPLGFIIIYVLFRYGSKDALPTKNLKIDYKSSILLALGISIFIYVLNDIKDWYITDLRIMGGLLCSVCLIGYYIHRERNQKIQTIPFRLFRNKAYLSAVLGEFFITMNFSMVLVLIGLYLQNTLHYSNFETGFIFFSMTMSMGFLSPVGGKIIDKFGIKVPMVCGLFCIAFGLGLMSFLKIDSSLLYIIISLFIVGIGFGTYFTSCSTVMMRSSPSQYLNVASGVFMMFSMVGNTLGLVLSTSLVVLLGTNHLLKNIFKLELSLSEQLRQELVRFISTVDQSFLKVEGLSHDQISQFLTLVSESFVYGMTFIMTFGVLNTFISAALSMWGLLYQKSNIKETFQEIQ